MKQLLIIHGGDSFSTYEAYRQYLDQKQPDYYKLTHNLRWKEQLGSQLEEFDVLYPTMPNSANAVYDEWVVYFSKIIPLLKDDFQLLGHSLGAMFLAKYLNDHPLERPANKLILVSGGYSEPAGELGSFIVTSTKNLPQSAHEVHLIHSTDDPVVPFSELAKFQADLPDAISHIFEDRGHFTEETFPEIIDIIKSVQ
jgi:predicted alpha/beta hydrolase family esterase